MPQPFTKRGSISHVTRKMNTLSNIPLTGNCRFFSNKLDQYIFTQSAIEYCHRDEAYPNDK